MVGRWQWPLRSTTAAFLLSSCSACCCAWRFCFARSIEAMVAGCGVPSAGVAGGRGGCPCRSAASKATRRRPRAPVAACHGVTAGAAGFCANGLARVFSAPRDASLCQDGSRARRPGRVGRGAARSGPLMERKLRALREALSAIPARAGRSRAPIGAARTGRSNRRKPVVGAAADNLQTRQPHQARIALQT